MKVDLEKSFPMPAGADAVWALLQDIEAVAGCVPGAKITGRGADGRYLGTIGVRLGPVSMTFKGDIEVKELNAARRMLRLAGKGSDGTGTSGASMDLTARIEAGDAGDSCVLVGNSEVSMSGKAAAFGGRMMGTVADQILNQFAANFVAQVRKLAAAPGASPAQDAATASTAAPDRSAEPAAGPANEINAISLLWSVLLNWLRGLFRHKAA